MTRAKVILYSLVLLSCSTSLFAADYYWVGDGGNWSDLSHWATTSGGAVTHSQVPTSEDNVFFDANSFTVDGQLIEFNNEIVFIRDFDMTAVTRAVTIRGDKNVILSSFGSLELSTNVTWDFSGIINFTGENIGNNINFAGNVSSNELYIAGGGQWQLAGDLEVDSIFQITEGVLNTSDYNIRTQYFYILTDAAKDISLTNSTIEIWGRYGDREFYDATFDTITTKINLTNLTLDPGTSVINFTAPITEVWFTGDGTINLYNVHFTSPVGRNYIRPFNSNAQVTWNTLELLGRTRMEGSHNISNWILNTNKIYRLQDGQTFTIDNIQAIGACNGGITITSLRAGLAVNIVSASDINLDFVTLRDLRASGGGNFVATNSTDLGNNSNWNFTNSEAVDFYWIGGAGNWTDPNHWSLSSGGTPSGCVPFGKDNAYFDINSFSGFEERVILDLEDVFIHDLIWDGVQGFPIIDGSEESSMHITGSLRYERDMTHSFGGYYYFESSETGNTIEMNGQPFRRELHFSGTGADWTTLDSIYVQWNVSHHSGTIITDGNYWDIWKYESFGDRPRHLDMRGSHIDLHDVLNQYNYPIYRPEWWIYTNNYTSDTEGSTIEFHTIYYAGFIHEGDEAGLDYNNVIFSSYGGELNSSNWMGDPDPMTIIDSCIFYGRGQSFGNQELNYLELTGGYDYRFRQNNNVKITQLNANGTCDAGHITILSTDVGRAANFEIANDHTLDRLIIQDIHNSGGTLTANNSLDQGNNVGWVIDGFTSRTLYWVNNTGQWEDSNHWSLTSGGPGGECIPTPIDDVIFDELSFNETNQSVYSDNNRILQCRDMTWTNVFGIPNFGYYYDSDTDTGFNTDNVKIHGSLEYDSDMNVNVYWHLFATNDSDSVLTNGKELPGIQMLGYGELTFLDDITSWSFDHNNGSVIMRDLTWRTNYYNTYNHNDALMNSLYENVEIHLGRENSTQSSFSDYGRNHNFQIINSTLYIDGPLNYVISAYALAFDRVISTDPNGHVIFGDRYPTDRKPDDVNEYSFHYVELASDATFLGQFRTDTLIGSPGKVYTLEAMETAYVEEYLQLIGNNCTPIQLRSNSAGILANISMPPNSTNVVNFIEMRDNNAIGGADFVAGSRSTDISQSNRGWLFEDPPQYVETGFLGADRALCRNASIDLNAYNYSPGETYLWSTGSADTILNVDQTGEYSVRVTFDNGCSIEDRIRILEPEDFQVSLGNDTIICAGTLLRLDAAIDFQGVSYSWSDSTKGAMIDISEEGEYRIYAEVDGCISSDTIEVTSQAIPMVELGENPTICEGDSITLSPIVNGLNVLWSDGSTAEDITISNEGSYRIQVEINSCTNSDSIQLFVTPLPTIDLGNDTLLCTGEVLSISIPIESDVSYLWKEEGSTSFPLTVVEADYYTLIGDRAGCSNSDSIYVDFQESINLNLGDNIKACEGDSILLTSNVMTDSYNWNTGSTDQSIVASTSGVYSISVERGVCSEMDSVDVVFNSYPLVDIGPSDTLLCSTDIYTLDAGAIGRWQNGEEVQTFSFSNSGIYSVVVDNEGCQTTDMIDITVQEAPQLELGSDRQACEQDVVTIDAGINADTYMWNTGAESATIDVISDGVYTVTLVEDACQVSDSISVSFNAYPLVDFGGPDTTICDEEEIILTVSQEGTWQDGSLSSEYRIAQEGLYHVLLDNNGCQSRDSLYINFLPLPQLDLGQDTTICEGDAFTIQAPTGIDDFIWEDGSMESIKTISQEGTYYVDAFKDGCSNADSIVVTVRQLPLLDLGRDTILCNGDILTIDPIQAEGSILWPDASNTPSFQVSEPDLIIATADNGCISTDSIQVDYRQCIYFSAYLPNTFSPNRDGLNDAFRPFFNEGIEILSYDFRIYDRWGGEIFASQNLEEGWNGLYDSQSVASGVYVYFVDIEYRDDIQQSQTTLKGDVMVFN